MKNKIGYVFLCLLLTPSLALCQYKYDYHWLVGYVNSPGSAGGALLNFNQQPMQAEGIPNEFINLSSTVTMSDADGNLIFYSDGCQIANANFEMMPNGDSINPGEVHDAYCSGYPDLVQSMLSIPSMVNPDKYLIFHMKHIIAGAIYPKYLLKTTIDMSLDEGLGVVVEKNKVLSNIGFEYGSMNAVKHSNGADWWLIQPIRKSNKYLTLHFHADTVSEQIIQGIGDSLAGDGNTFAKFSPEGTKYVRYQHNIGIQIFDFDRNTGIFSNPQKYTWDDLTWGGCEFSASGGYLYISNFSKIYQIDMEADDIGASRITVAEDDDFTFSEQNYPTNFFKPMRGPDCRIYISTTSSAPYYSVIMYPDRAGVACDVHQHGLALPAYNYWTLPYHPNYRLDTEYAVCDSTIGIVLPTLPLPAHNGGNIKASPNPASTLITLQGHVPPQVRAVSVRVFNISGQQMGVWQVAISGNELQLQIDVSTWPSGIYSYQVLSTDGYWGGGGRLLKY